MSFDLMWIFITSCILGSVWCSTKIFGLLYLFLFAIYFAVRGAIGLLRSRKSYSDKCMLSSKIDSELNELKVGKGFFIKWKYFVSELVHPSKITIWHFIAPGILMFVLSRLILPFKFEVQLDFRDSNHYQNLIAIAAGLGSVIFALTIFIADKFKGDDDIEAKVLLRESDLYYLSILSIFSLIVFAWGKSGILSIVVLIITTIYALRAVYVVFSLLLSKGSLLDKELKYWSSEVAKSVEEALQNRVGNNLFLKHLDEDHFSLDFSFWRDEREKYVDFKLSSYGEIQDVNLCQLDNLESYLQDLATKVGKTFLLGEETLAVPEQSAPNTDLIDMRYVETSEVRRERIKALVYKKVGDVLDGDNLVALSVPSFVLDDSSKDNVQKLLDKIYVVREKPITSMRDELSVELRSKKDVVVSAIRGGQTSQIDRATDLYEVATTTFLDIMAKVGGGYGWKEANKERGAIIGGWDEIRWVATDIRDLLAESVDSGNSRVVSKLAHIPVTISAKSIKYADHFVFQEFLPVYIYFYDLSFNVKSEELRKALIEKSWRPLTEICDYYVGSELEKNGNDSKALNELKYYVVDVLKIFLLLLKKAFDADKVDDFQIFHKAVTKILRSFKPSKNNTNFEHYEWMLRSRDLTADDRARYLIASEHQRDLENVEKEISELKTQLFFGMGAWIISKSLDHREDSERILKYWRVVKGSLPTNLTSFTGLYKKLRSFESEQFWGWDWWELEEKGGEGEAVWMDVGGKIDLLYAVVSVLIVSSLSDEQILRLDFKVDRDFVYYINGVDSPIRKILTDIKSHPEKWSLLVPDDAISKIDVLFELYDLSVKSLEEIEEEFLVNAPVDSNKKVEFFQSFEKAFYAESSVRSIYELFGKFIRRKRKVRTGVLLWGFNQINDKAAFIDKWHVGYPDFGKHYGEELASAEDSRLYAEMRSAFNVIEMGSGELSSKLPNICNNLRDNRLDDTGIVMFTQMYSRELDDVIGDNLEFRRSYMVEKNRYSDIPGYVGAFKLDSRVIPVFQVDDRRDTRDDSIVVLNMDLAGEIVRYLPYENSSQRDRMSRNGDFIFEVIDLNDSDNTRQSILSKNPTWLSNHTNPDRFLRQKVVLKILEKVAFRRGQSDGGIVIKLTDNNS